MSLMTHSVHYFSSKVITACSQASILLLQERCLLFLLIRCVESDEMCYNRVLWWPQTGTNKMLWIKRKAESTGKLALDSVFMRTISSSWKFLSLHHHKKREVPFAAHLCVFSSLLEWGSGKVRFCD